MVELVTGQRAQLTRIKRANARYKVREGFLEGAKTQLHGEQMYDFMDKLVTQVLPRVTDFNGLTGSSFDGKGNLLRRLWLDQLPGARLQQLENRDDQRGLVGRLGRAHSGERLRPCAHRAVEGVGHGALQ